MGASHIQRIGLLGGTFDPVHVGHVQLAQDALEKAELDEIWFLPAARPPHKTARPILDFHHRAAMLDLAVADQPRMAVCRIEAERAGLSFTLDTIRALKARYADVHWVFLIGSDSLPELITWHKIETLLELCEFRTMLRPGHDDPATLMPLIHLPPPWPERLVANAFKGHLVDVSSSDIRERVAQGRSIQTLVPNAVADYIREHRLYLTQE